MIPAMNVLPLLTASLSAAPWSLILIIASIICLAIAVFFAPSVDAERPFYNRVNFGWLGILLFVISVALG